MTFSLEPLRFLLHPVALLAFAAAAQAWIDGADTRAIVSVVLGVLIAAATEAARKRVTPDAKLAGEPGGRRGRSSWGRGGEAGYGLVELLVAVILIVLLVWLVLALVPDADAAVDLARSSWGRSA